MNFICCQLTNISQPGIFPCMLLDLCCGIVIALWLNQC